MMLGECLEISNQHVSPMIWWDMAGKQDCRWYKTSCRGKPAVSLAIVRKVCLCDIRSFHHFEITSPGTVREAWQAPPKRLCFCPFKSYRTQKKPHKRSGMFDTSFPELHLCRNRIKGCGSWYKNLINTVLFGNSQDIYSQIKKTYFFLAVWLLIMSRATAAVQESKRRLPAHAFGDRDGTFGELYFLLGPLWLSVSTSVVHSLSVCQAVGGGSHDWRLLYI